MKLYLCVQHIFENHCLPFTDIKLLCASPKTLFGYVLKSVDESIFLIVFVIYVNLMQQADELQVK